MLNNYLMGGLAAVILILSLVSYGFYKDNQSKMLEIGSLKEEQSRLNTVIENRDIQIQFQEKRLVIQENALKENRIRQEDKQVELQKIEEKIASEPGYSDEAAASLKKLFESLKDRK